MEKLYQIGPVKLAFRNFPQDGQWPFWNWKLNPFSVAHGQPDIVVQCDGGPVHIEGEPIWADSARGFRREMHVLSNGSLLWQQLELPANALQLQFVMAADGRKIRLTCDHTQTIGMGAFESLTFLIFYALLHRQVLTFHGALVEADQKGFLLCAPSGGGKTTHARLWRDGRNGLILNGDRATCYRQGEQWVGFGTPWCGTSGEYLNRQVPLQAIVILCKGDENRVCRVTGMSLLQHILPHVVYPCWDRTATETVLELLDDMLKKISVLQLSCTPDQRAVDALYHAMENQL